MTRKQLQGLISAGVFSATLLSGAAYADNTGTARTKNSDVVSPSAEQTKSQDEPASMPKGTAPSDSGGVDASVKNDVKSSSSTSKGFAQHGCAGAGGCGGN